MSFLYNSMYRSDRVQASATMLAETLETTLQTKE
jgi:hypothetical protein